MAGHMTTMKSIRETDLSPAPNAEAVVLVTQKMVSALPTAAIPTMQSLARDIVAALHEGGHLTGPAEVQWGVRPTGWSDVVVRGSEQDALEYAVVNGDDPDWKVVRRRTGPGPWYPAPTPTS